MNSETSNSRSKWMVILLVVITLGYAPMLYRHFQGLWRLPQYQFFPLVILAVVYIAYDRGLKPRHIREAFQSMSILQYLVALVAAVLLVLATLVPTPNAAMLSWVIFSGAVVASLSRNCGKSLWGPWLATAVLIRLPGIIDGRLIGGLQLLSSKVSSSLLDWLGINHLLTGNVFYIGSRSLFVDEACSGVVSMYSILACASIYAAYQRYSFVRTAAIIVAGVLCTTLLNVMRIFLIVYAEDVWKINLADGLPHTLLGIGLFTVSLSLLWVADKILGIVLQPIPDTPNRSKWVGFWNKFSDNENFGSQQPKTQSTSGQTSPRRSLILAVLMLLSFGIWAGRGALSTSLKMNRVSILETLGPLEPSEIFKPDQSNEYTYDRVERPTGHQHGDVSHVFHFKDDHPHDFSVDLPFFDGWHELTSCYIGTGWSIEDRVVKKDGEGSYVEVELLNESGQHGFLLFSLVDSDGFAVTSRPSSSMPTWSWFELKRRMMGGISDELVQFQLWCPSSEVVDESTRDAMRKRFLQLRKMATTNLLPSVN